MASIPNSNGNRKSGQEPYRPARPQAHRANVRVGQPLSRTPGSKMTCCTDKGDSSCDEQQQLAEPEDVRIRDDLQPVRHKPRQRKPLPMSLRPPRFSSAPQSVPDKLSGSGRTPPGTP